MQSTPTDLHFQGLKKGDDSAYRDLFNRFFPLLISAAYRILHNEDDAKDVVQNVFVNIYSRREYLQVTELKFYLMRAVKNECLNYLRSKNRLRMHHEAYSQSIEDISDHDLLEHAEHEERIYSAIRSLPLQCQKVFTMSRLEHRNNQEIAQELGVSIRTVETHISNALKSLRRQLSIISIFF
jgi:RNA polymerase sigma-70 factor (family 1)